MAVLTLEGIVEAGQIRLLNGEHLPDKTNVYIVVPNIPTDIDANEATIEERVYPVNLPSNPRVMSPRLVNSGDAPHFTIDVSK